MHIFTGMLLGPFALFKFTIFATSSGSVVKKRNLEAIGYSSKF